MARSRRRRRNRGMERLKNLLILFLSLSALYLTLLALVPNRSSASPKALLEELISLFHPQQTQSVTPSVTQDQLSVAIRPVRMSVYDGSQRFALQYDTANVDKLYDSLGILLGEALASARPPTAITESQWQDALQSPGVWFDFLGCLPLETLCAWTGGGFYNELLTHSARQMAVALDRDGVKLYYHNEGDGLYYACKTSVAYEGHMDSLIAQYGSNGVSFVFELGESSGYRPLDPYVLIASGTLSPQIYRSSNPLAGLDSARVEEVQNSLSFQTSSYPIPDGIRIREGQETLDIRSNGTVTYTTADGTDSRYPVGGGDGYTATELVDITYRMAAATVGRYCGSARLYLMDIQQTDGAWEVRYGYCLNGCAVNLSDQDHAARFTVQGGQITDFTLCFRRYEDSGQTGTVLPERQAAAALEALDTQERELALCYWDNGGDTTQAGWAAR